MENTSKNTNTSNQNQTGAVSTVQKVVKYIEGEIKCGNLQGGSKIPTENELCSILNVSRTSVREAIKTLESMTVLSVRQGDGTYINNPENISAHSSLRFKMLLDGTTWNELFEFREQLEFIVIRCAIQNATDEDITCLEKLNQKLIACRDNNAYNYNEFYRIDSAFHKRLVKATHNRMLEDVYGYSFEIFSSLIIDNYKAGQGIDPTIESHIDYYNALVNKDIFLAGYAAHNAVKIWSKWAKTQNHPFFPIKE